MGFVNEYASEADVARLGLPKLWKKYRRFPPDQGFRYDWTVDKDRKIYLIRVATGHEDLGNRVTFILGIPGTRFECALDLIPGTSSGLLTEKPFRITWALVRIQPSIPDPDKRAATVSILKMALTTYGYAGARRQIPDTIVAFQF